MAQPLGAPDALRGRFLAAAQSETKARLDRAQQELVSGERLDRQAASGGDVARIAALERSIAAIDSRLPLIGLAKNRAEVSQDALAAVQTLAQGVGLNLVNDVRVGDVGTAILTAREAEGRIEGMLQALNVTFAGRPLFGGANADGAPMGSAAELVGFVRAALDAYPDVDQALQAVDDFFDPPAPPAVTTYPGPETYDADFYRGSAVDAPPVEIAPGERIAYAVRGDAPAIKELLKNMAVAAAVEGSLNFAAGTPERAELFRRAGEAIINVDSDVAVLRSTLGMAESRIEQAETRAQADKTTLGVARNDMVARDPFEAATEVTELETRLQTIYEITARLSQLSFVNFLR